MDIDHEARKHDVPRHTVKGEAERTAAEDPSGQLQEVLQDAKEAVHQDSKHKERDPAKSADTADDEDER
jgi:hypothetical protein